MQLETNCGRSDFHGANRRRAVGTGRIGGRRRLGAGIAVLLVLAAVLSFGAPRPAHALTPGRRLEIPFPRLGVWGPDPRSQSLDDIARYDYVVLYSYYAWSIPYLKVRNPDIILLTYQSAIQQPLFSAPGVPDYANRWLFEVPNEWMLTRVGSKLTYPVNADSTTIPVTDVTVFRVGDVVVLDKELAKVEGIGADYLKVRRGLIPSRGLAAAHLVGTRVAAIVMWDATSVLMDVSTMCPKVTVDPKVGPETWGEYNARLGISVAASAQWDGLALDWVDGNMSRKRGSRSIDPDRSNTSVTDNYAAFDSASDAGLRRYETLIRAGVASDKIIPGNCARWSFDLLNGSNLEGFPRSNPAAVTRDWPFSSYWQSGLQYYLNWVRLGQQPNLSTVTTHDNDSASDRSNDPGWHPDYRKMRLGLCTTLMGDGFFEDLVSTASFAATGLLWFDEYDNAGTRTGYLGQPLGGPRLALGPLATPDLLHGDGALSTPEHWNAWRLWADSGYAATAILDGGTARIRVTASGGRADRVSFLHESVPISAGEDYTLTFRARADRPLSVSAQIDKPTSPYASWTSFTSVALDTNWRTFELQGARPPRGSDPAARLRIGLGGAVGTIWIDDVKIRTGSRLKGVHRRDFDGGVALVNGTDTTATVELGGTFSKIRGTQAPSINDGGPVSVAIIPPRDGLVVVGNTSTLSAWGGGTAAYGGAKWIGGSLKGTANRLLAGRAVTLQRSFDPGSVSWADVAVGSTDSSGACSFEVVPSRTTHYRMRFSGDARYVGATSPVVKVEYATSLTAPALSAAPMVNTAVSLSGYAKPKHSVGSEIQLQCYHLEGSVWVLRMTKWVTASDYLDHTRYSGWLSFALPGSWLVRSCHPADDVNAETYSGWTKVMVTKGTPALSATAWGMVSGANPISVLRGQLNSPMGQGLANRTLVLQRSYDRTTWTSIATTTTGLSGYKAGRYSFSLEPLRNTYYRVTFAGDADYVSVTSQIVYVTAQCRLTAPEGDAGNSGRVGSFPAHGYLQPRHAAGGRDIEIHISHLENGVWVWKGKVLATNYDDPRGTRYAATVTFPSVGSWSLKAYHFADSANLETGSAYSYFTVAP
jgi:hypothetical protein